MSGLPPHLAIYIRFLYGGGAERVLVNLMQNFVQQGVKVDLILNRAEGPYMSEVPPQVRVIDLNTKKILAGLPKLIRYLQQERPAALLSSLHYPNEIAILAKHLAFVKTKVFVSEQNTLSVHARKEPGSQRWTPLFARLLYPWADGVIANSRGVASDLAQVTGLSSDRIPLIYNPVIGPHVLERAQAPVEHPWFQPNSPPVILGVGRLDPQKDFPTLIKAFARVRETRDCRLVILGMGRDKAKLEQLTQDLGIESDVLFPGFVDNPYAYMAKAKMFVLSSLWEGLPTVLLEALAIGIPVISTDCPSGPAEILDNGRYGLLVPMGDDRLMAKAMLEVLSGENLVVAPEWLEQFTTEAVTRQYSQALGLS